MWGSLSIATKSIGPKWRMVMRRSHYCLAYFISEVNNLYGVLDGHGGAEVAEQCQKLVP